MAEPPSFLETLPDWVYMGAPMDMTYYRLASNGRPPPDPVSACEACGARMDARCYVKHRGTDAVRTVCIQCFGKLPALNREHTCEDCGAVHHNRSTNKCNDCRPDGAEARAVQVRRWRMAVRRGLRSPEEVLCEPLPDAEFEDIIIRFEHLAFLNKAIFPNNPQGVSWSARTRVGDDDTVYFSMFYNRQIQATLYYDAQGDKVVRTRAQGGAAVQSHIDANADRLQGTLHLLMELSRAEAEESTSPTCTP